MIFRLAVIGFPRQNLSVKAIAMLQDPSRIPSENSTSNAQDHGSSSSGRDRYLSSR